MVKLVLLEPDNTTYAKFLEDLLTLYRDAKSSAKDGRLSEQGRQRRVAVEALLVAHGKQDPLLDEVSGEVAETMDLPTSPEDSVATDQRIPNTLDTQEVELSRETVSPDDVSRTGTIDKCRDTLAGATIAGRYTLQEKIGEGGMGEI